jgi:glutamine amidotransferase-like uncharacterized protein
MKRSSLAIAAAIALVVIFTGCDGITIQPSGPTGIISVTIPEMSAKAIDASFAQTNSNRYSIYVYNAGGVTATSVAESGTVSIEVLEGVYKVLVLAGHEVGKEVWLLGSGLAAKAVEVLAGDVTPVTVTLASISFSFSLDTSDPVPSGGSFGVTASGGFGTTVVTLANEVVAPFEAKVANLDGTDATDPPTETSLTYDYNTKKGTWEGTASLTAPPKVEESTTFYVDFAGAQLKLSDSDYPELTNDLVSDGYAWLWISRASEGLTIAETRLPLEVTGSSSTPKAGVAVTIEWGK